MNYDKFDNILFLKLLAFTVVALLCSIIFSPRAEAALTGAPSNTYPDTSIPGEVTTWAVVQIVDKPIKMKARSTIANIYIPNSSIGTEQTIRFIQGCDNIGRDYGGGNGNTDFIIEGNTGSIASVNNDAVCGGGKQDVYLAFTPTLSNTGGATEDFQIYRFIANGNGREELGYRYLNAFQVQAQGAGALVGLSDRTEGCAFKAYPWSCPTGRPGSGARVVYSSFYGGSPSQGYYGQQIVIVPCANGATRSGGVISLYDLDANDENYNPSNLGLNQNIRMRLYKGSAGSEVRQTFVIPGSNTVVDEIDHTLVKLWGFAYPGFGGNEDNYMDLPPPGDTANADLGNFEPNTRYRLEIVGLSKDNAIQMLTSLSPCPPTPVIPETPMTCNAITKVVAAAGSYQQISFTINNKSSFDWVASGATYDIGVVDTSFAGSKLNQAGTTFPKSGQGGNGPPDHQSAPYLQDGVDGTNNKWTYENYNRDSGAAVNATVERYSTTENIAAGGSRNFSVFVKLPDKRGVSKEYGIRMLSRDARFGQYSWMNWSSTCTFTVETTANQPPSGTITGPSGSGVAVCNVLGTNRLTGTVKSGFTVSDGEGDALTIRLTAPVTQTKTRTGTGTGSFDDFARNRGQTYTLTGTVSDAYDTVALTSATVTCPPPPNATCTVITSAFTIDPRRNVQFEVDIDATGPTAWPATSSTKGLHLAIATKNTTNWNSNGAGISPSPDSSSPFFARDGIDSQPLVNAVYYDVTESGVSGRYQVTSPTKAGNTTVRAQAPDTTGDYDVVFRMYDREAQYWLENRCTTPDSTNDVDVEVKLLPLTCAISTDIFDIEVNTPFESQVAVLNPNLVQVPIQDASYKSSRERNDSAIVFSGQGTEKSLNSAARTPFVRVTDAAPNANGGNQGSIVVYSPQLQYSSPGDYYLVWNVEYLNKGVTERPAGCDGGVWPPTPTIPVSNKPYAKLYGNDIFAGGGFGQQCEQSASTSSPSAIGHLRINSAPADGGDPYYQGASAELAVFAVDRIRGVLPGEKRSVPSAANEIRKLAFANSGDGVTINTGSYEFGGGFNQTICSEDWWSNRDGDTEIVLASPIIDLASFNGSQKSYIIEATRLSGSPLTVYASSSITDETRITIYVEGDVVVGSNGGVDTGIRYANNTWNDTSKIPGVFIIAQGNVYVDHDIEELNGVFVAQPDPANPDTTGKIHTCYSYGLGDLILKYNLGVAGQEAASQFLSNQCARKLTVTGAFVANDIYLLRTVGTTSSAPRDEPQTSGNIAEVFRFNPLLYVTGGDGVPKTTREATVEYDSILSLPPSF